MAIDFSTSRGALVMAHPGHELHLYRWLHLARPICFVLTDGSGTSGKSRLESTTKLLAESGAQTSAIYGHLTDRALYAAVLKGEFNLFRNLAEKLTEELIQEQDRVCGRRRHRSLQPGPRSLPVHN